MSTSMSKYESRKFFEYVLRDFLEIKAALNVEQTVSIKSFLASKGCLGSSLLPLEGFCVNQQLVLLRSGDPRSIKHLVYVNPSNGLIRIKPL